MILAVKRKAAGNSEEAWRQVEEIKSYYGVREHCLETLLKQRIESAVPA